MQVTKHERENYYGRISPFLKPFKIFCVFFDSHIYFVSCTPPFAEGEDLNLGDYSIEVCSAGYSSHVSKLLTQDCERNG